MADLPLLLHAKDVGAIDAGDRGEGRTFAGRVHAKTCAAVGKVDLPDKGVRLFDGRNSGEPQFLRAPVLATALLSPRGLC